MSTIEAAPVQSFEADIAVEDLGFGSGDTTEHDGGFGSGEIITGSEAARRDSVERNAGPFATGLVVDADTQIIIDQLDADFEASRNDAYVSPI